jgi:hypothetical protein
MYTSLMLSPNFEAQLEQATISLNRWAYAESIGLPVDEKGYAAPAEALARLYAELLEQGGDEGARYFALENWAEARLAALDQQVSAARDQHLSIPSFTSSEGPLTWRNWKAFEREAQSAEQLAEGFERMVEASAQVRPALEARLAHLRADYAQHGITPIHTYCWREGITPEFLRAFLRQIGQACRAPFQEALNVLSGQVFGRPAGPAELRALYLNRMYEPNAHWFSAKTGIEWVQDTQAAFARFNFDLSHIPVDVENRPRKYPGAFCFPIATPADVRVSVRIASAHHLVDMLYHEFGHAVHFSGIRADLPLVDRYWIHSGAHETFSTLFEHLLGEPALLREQFNVGDDALAALLNFHHFKNLLVGTWLGASALTTLEGWLDNLTWLEIEDRYAANLLAFTGVPMPPGFARLEPFTAQQSVYPAGYVLAAIRVTHWLNHLRALSDNHWWHSPAAHADIREKVRAGGQVRFSDEWLEPEPFLRRHCV